MDSRLSYLLLLVILSSVSTFMIEQNELQAVDINGLLKLKAINRSIDGSGNNLNNPNWGKSFINFLRKGPARYQDGKGTVPNNLPNSRYLSEAVVSLEDNIVIPNQYNLTMLFGTWGQFLDHDLTLSN